MEKKQTTKLVVVEPAPLSTNKFSVDWSKCCICQDKSKENLLCPGRNKDSSKTLSGYCTLADNLCAFKKIGELGSIKHFDELDEGLGIATTLSIHEAKWHKSCRLKYNDTKLKRAQKRIEARAQTAESSRLTRSSVPPVEASVDKVCFLCTLPEKRNNKLHLVTTLQLSERVKEWAKNVMDARLIGMLQTSDLVASEARYHHKCLQNLRNRCRKNSSSASSETSVCEAIAFAELVAYMQDKMVSENYNFVFPMSTLTKMYKNRLAQLLSIPECELPDVRSTTLRESILDEFPQLLVHRPSKGYQLVCKSTDLSAHAHSDDLSQDAIAFARFPTALRKEMFKWKTSFKGTFDQDCQKSSVPSLLLASVNTIVYGTWSPKECNDALKMHTLRAAYQAGFVWGQALDPSGVIPSPADWGWTQTEGEWQPLWTTQPSIWEAARELVKCGCKNSCSGRCSCRREGMPCTLLCKSCYGNCDNTSGIDREAFIEE